jgi:type III secretory pathway component EscS
MEFEVTMISMMLRGMWTAVILAGPPLLIATGVGLLIALLQTLIQLQEQTLPVAVKIIAVSAVLLTMGGMLFNPLFLLTIEIFDNFYVIVG